MCKQLLPEAVLVRRRVGFNGLQPHKMVRVRVLLSVRQAVHQPKDLGQEHCRKQQWQQTLGAPNQWHRTVEGRRKSLHPKDARPRAVARHIHPASWTSATGSMKLPYKLFKAASLLGGLDPTGCQVNGPVHLYRFRRSTRDS